MVEYFPTAGIVSIQDTMGVTKLKMAKTYFWKCRLSVSNNKYKPKPNNMQTQPSRLVQNLLLIEDI